MRNITYNGKPLMVTEETMSIGFDGKATYELKAVPRSQVDYIFKFRPMIERLDARKVIHNEPATIVIWEDGTKTVVKCSPNDHYDREKGLLMCIAKKMYGSKAVDILRKWCR